MLVFDSSTLILTAKIELLDLFLSEIGMEVAIPRSVEEECCGGKKKMCIRDRRECRLPQRALNSGLAKG